MSTGTEIVSSILSDLGWDENLAIPVANEENQNLLHLIDIKQKQTINNKNDLDRINEKLTSMYNHLKNCRQELQHTLMLRNAKLEQSKSEDHMTKVSERELGRLQQEIKKMENKIKDIFQKKNNFENTLFKKTTELEELKQQMKWDQQALEAWLEESEKKGEDIMLMQKYARQDEAKINELSLQLEQLTANINDKRGELEKHVVETKTIHVELEKTTDEYQKAHQDRQDIIGQWETTINQMKRRDNEIDSLSKTLQLLKDGALSKQKEIKSRDEFYQNLVNENYEIGKNVELTEKQTGKLRVEQKGLEEQRFNFQSELEALKRTCDRTASDLEQARVVITQLKKEKAEKEQKKERAISKRLELEEKLKGVKDEKLTAEEKANIADKMLEEEENKHVKFEQELKHTRDLQFKKAQELHESEVDQKNIIAELNGNSTAIRNLNGKIHRLDHDLLKQQEILYTQDFAIQQLERRINRMHGEHSNEEKEILEETIRNLTENLESVTKVAATLNGQIKRVQDDIRRCNYDMEKINNDNFKTTEKLEEVNLQNDRTQQELKRYRNEKEKLMVEDNIMKLVVKRLRDRLHNKADQVYNLDKRKLQLEQAVRERFAEIKIHKDMLMLQTRSADEERSKINADYKSRLSKIGKLEKRYEILTVSMAPPEGEEEQSQAFYVIKAAQEKEALQRQGDELDAKIRKAEKEIRALENTLMLMNNCNQNYRQSLMKITDTSEEASVKKDLDVQLRTVMEKYNFRKRQLAQLEEDYQVLKETLDNLCKDEFLYQEQVDGILEQLTQKEKEKMKQQEKIDRAETIIAKLRNDILESARAEEFEFIEKDINIREKKEFNRIVINEFQRYIQNQYPTLNDITYQYLDAAKLIVQPSGSSRSSVTGKTSSVASSRSSVSSQSAFSAGSSRMQTKPSVTIVQMGLDDDLPPSSQGSQRSVGRGFAKSSSVSGASSKSSTVRSGRSSISSRSSRVV